MFNTQINHIALGLKLAYPTEANKLDPSKPAKPVLMTCQNDAHISAFLNLLTTPVEKNIFVGHVTVNNFTSSPGKQLFLYDITGERSLAVNGDILQMTTVYIQVGSISFDLPDDSFALTFMGYFFKLN